jgi:hypothetical protein
MADDSLKEKVGYDAVLGALERQVSAEVNLDEVEHLGTSGIDEGAGKKGSYQAVITARPVAPYPAPDWLEGKTVVPQETHIIDPNEQEIADMLAAGHSLREIQQQVFGDAGGAAYEAVKWVQARLARED